MAAEAAAEAFQSRLPGVGGSAFAGNVAAPPSDCFQSRLPGVGGSAATIREAIDLLTFNPVCRELGAPPVFAERRASSAPHFQSRLPGVGGSAFEVFKGALSYTVFQSRLPGVGGSAVEELSGMAWDLLSIPFAGSWGLRPRRGPRRGPRPRLSIPFAGSWGLRPSRLTSQRTLRRSSFNPVCRELGAPPATEAYRDIEPRHFQSRLPGVGGSARRHRTRQRRRLSFNPVCRELGAPPAARPRWRAAYSRGPFNPVCRELGAPPSWYRNGKQSGEPPFNPVCRELGAPPIADSRGLRGLPLSIPFAGSWGLRRLSQAFFMAVPSFNPVCRELGAPPSFHRVCGPSSTPFNPVCRELGAPPSARVRVLGSGGVDFQSRLPGVGGSAKADSKSVGGVASFNPVCRELGAPPRGRDERPRRTATFNPVCRELGAPPPRRPPPRRCQRLSIPFAGSWGLRPRG